MPTQHFCSIDNALAPKRMPYWDVRWDLRLPWPADSVVFGANFFQEEEDVVLRRRSLGKYV
ncbi:hypothetical protein NECAME_15817 [Necator americanus]|uniref:Uncharacterized protein n=1 Tax=Necator americanus TaxID=51031 RepID=W2SFQ7_NECAM|nr:hypothetical protein NECAME_15817 [Necator americanus]ETN68449.1 hypothetical protein NECAME_15817 [Necator americanus]